MSAFTPHAVRLAAVYFPILVDCAKRKRLMTSGELVSAAKARHPRNEDVTKAIAGSSGMKLDVIKSFCKKSNFPDLAGLVINVGAGASDDDDAEKPEATDAQRQAFDFDWEKKLVVFDTYIIDELKRAVPQTKRKEPEAAKVLFEYYSAHKSTLPPDIAKHRPKLLALLMEGRDPEDVFAEVAEGL